MAAAKGRRKGSEGGREVVLGADLRIGAVTAVRDELLAAMKADGPIRVDASAVAQLDAAGLQLLHAFAENCRQRDMAWEWQGVGDALQRGAALAGLHASLALPAAPTNA